MDNEIRVTQGKLLYRVEDQFTWPIYLFDTPTPSDVRSIVLTVSNSDEYIETFKKTRDAGGDNMLVYQIPPQVEDYRHPIVAISKISDTRINVWIRAEDIKHYPMKLF